MNHRRHLYARHAFLGTDADYLLVSWWPLGLQLVRDGGKVLWEVGFRWPRRTKKQQQRLRERLEDLITQGQAIAARAEATARAEQNQERES